MFDVRSMSKEGGMTDDRRFASGKGDGDIDYEFAFT